MSIITKDWFAQIDRMPYEPSFRTNGTVTVPNPGVTPKLVASNLQDKSFDLRLDLTLETEDGIWPQVLTDKFVEYRVPGNSNVSAVSIYFEGELIHHIDEVMITH